MAIAVLDVAIVGGGLSGLAVAHGLAQNTRKKLSFVVLEGEFLKIKCLSYLQMLLRNLP